VTIPLLLAAVLPGLFWEAGVETAPSLRQAGVERLYVPADRAAAWREAGFAPVPVDAALERSLEKLKTPGVQWRMEVAGATRAPWVDASGWLFARRRAQGAFKYALPAGTARLAAAESFAYGADAVLQIARGDLEGFGRMLGFLRQVGPSSLPPMANIAVQESDSPLLDEVLNLLARRNLLFRVVSTPDPASDLNVKLGSREFPEGSARNPVEFASRLRQQLGDERRLLRIFGSEVVLGRLEGDGARARLHLINYGQRRTYGLRVRVRGPWKKAVLRAEGVEHAAPADLLAEKGAIEFSVPEMAVYAVADLER
jgi:hypothetical protein